MYSVPRGSLRTPSLRLVHRVGEPATRVGVRPSRALSRLAGVLAVGLVASACSGSAYSYVKSSRANAYFKVPSSWKLFSGDEVLSQAGSDLSPQALERLKRSQWIVAFDASPKPSLANVFDLQGRHPGGFARVRTIGADERDSFSIASMRNEVFPIDQLLQDGSVEPLEEKELSLPGGYRGVRIVYNIKVQGNGFHTFHQTAVVDPSTRRLYLLVIGCNTACYLKNQSTIRTVADSWTVRKR